MSENTETQNLAIARYLLGGGSLTALEALERFGCMRLASRICDLRTMIAAGIHDDFVEVGDGKRVKKYWIDKADVQAVKEVREKIVSGAWFGAMADVLHDAAICEPLYNLHIDTDGYSGVRKDCDH